MKNFIQNLENEFVEKNQEKTTFSIRLSVKEDLILQEIADSFDLSRQELLHRLITEQIIVPWKKRFEEQANEELEEVDTEQSTRYFLLNTNKVNDIDDHDFMLKNQVAAAFEDGYKEKIAKFKKGDWVFLYESGQGIIAFGQRPQAAPNAVVGAAVEVQAVAAAGEQHYRVFFGVGFFRALFR